MGFSRLEMEIISETIDTNINVKDYLDNESYLFLMSLNRTDRFVSDHVWFSRPKQKRIKPSYFNHYLQTMVLTKFLTPETSVSDFIFKITEFLTGFYIICVDFSIMCLTRENEFRFMFPSRNTCVNEKKKIADKDDWKSLNSNEIYFIENI